MSYFRYICQLIHYYAGIYNSDLQYCQMDEICKAVLHWARHPSGALYIFAPRKKFGRELTICYLGLNLPQVD